MQIEQRREQRFTLTRQPKGRLHVMLGERCLDVHAVKDFSPMGLGLEVGGNVGIGENVVIRYLTEGIDLTLHGSVVWASNSAEDIKNTAQGDTHIVGIRLVSPTLLQAYW